MKQITNSARVFHLVTNRDRYTGVHIASNIGMEGGDYEVCNIGSNGGASRAKYIAC
jgi:hypothetical protein